MWVAVKKNRLTVLVKAIEASLTQRSQGIRKYSLYNEWTNERIICIARSKADAIISFYTAYNQDLKNNEELKQKRCAYGNRKKVPGMREFNHLALLSLGLPVDEPVVKMILKKVGLNFEV